MKLRRMGCLKMGMQTEISGMRPQQRACNWSPALYPSLHVGGIQRRGGILFRQISMLIHVCFDVGQAASGPFSIANYRLVLAEQRSEEHPFASPIKCISAVAMYTASCTDEILLNTPHGGLHQWVHGMQ